MKLMKIVKLLTAAAIVTLFAGCNVLFEPDTPVPSGSGEVSQVTVNIGGNARTLLPDLSGVAGYSFYLSAVPASSGTPVNEWLDFTTGTKTILLTYGFWNITVTAYADGYAVVKGTVTLEVDNPVESVIIPINTPEEGGIGTFEITVTYPFNATAFAKLESWPLPSGTYYHSGIISYGYFDDTVSGLDSGIYFLTVSATLDTGNGDKTVTRNEIVHIYDQLTTYGNYTFTESDFEEPITLSGTIPVWVNGSTPNLPILQIWADRNGDGNDVLIKDNVVINGDGTWNTTLVSSDWGLATDLYFFAGPHPNVMEYVTECPVPTADISGIDSNGDIEFNITDLLPSGGVWDDVWLNSGEEQWYILSVTPGTSYQFWLNNITLNGKFELYTNFWDNPINSSNVWGALYTLPINSSVTEVYIRVRGTDNNHVENYLAYSDGSVPVFLEEGSGSSATLTHLNPTFTSYSWGSAAVNGNVAGFSSGVSGNFAYVYPVGATGFDIEGDEWDFATLYVTTTGTVSYFSYKLYPNDSADAYSTTGNPPGGRNGALVSNGDSTIKLEIRKVPSGLGFQKYDTDNNVLTVEITKVVFSKGTRYNVTLEANGGTVDPTTTYFVDGTKVANHFPVPILVGHTFLGWKNTATNNWATSDVTVSQTEFDNAEFEAQWVSEVNVVPVIVNFTGNVSGPSTIPATVIDDPTSGIGYELQSSGNQLTTDWVMFELDLTVGGTINTGAKLVNFDKVTFKVGTGNTANYKTLTLYASETDFSSASGLPSTEGAIAVGSVATAGAGTSYTITIDKAKAISLNASTLYFSIQGVLDNATQKYVISNVQFKTND